MSLTEGPPEPWGSFFADLDALLSEEINLHCCGGFALTQHYGVARTTSDVDFIGVVPGVWKQLVEIAGKGSSLHRRRHLYLDPITVATPPENYGERLIPMFPGSWTHLNLSRWRLTIWLCRS